VFPLVFFAVGRGACLVLMLACVSFAFSMMFARVTICCFLGRHHEREPVEGYGLELWK
jgi:hypothetical protein